MWQIYEEKIDCLKRPVRWVLSFWKIKNSLAIWRIAGMNCCNSITLRLILLTNLYSVIDKCQTGMTATCRLMPSVTERRFVATSFLVDGTAYSRSFCESFSAVIVNIISSLNKMMQTSLDKYVEQLFWTAEFCMEVRFTQLRVIAIFEHRHFYKVV